VTGRPLAGKRIVVTRPRPQAEGLARAIRAAGGEAVLVPAIEIRDLPDPAPFRAVAARLQAFDWAIFVSPTAVRKALALLRAARGEAAWPDRLRVAAIGRASARALREAGFGAVLAPQEGADSEALLALPEFARPAGARIVIFRGAGGRELLGETLAARGASVEYAECYARARPDPVAGAQCAAADAFTVSSGEGLANLVAMLDDAGRARLREVPLFVPHARVAQSAAALGVRTVIVAGPGDAENLAALVAYFDPSRPQN
jgi:uroporphyrinogen-III synthase